MGRVLTNATALIAARESSTGVLPGSPSWFVVEFDSIGAYGAQITTVARRPISLDRGRKKGTVTDLDSAVEVDTDLTIDVFARFAESFFFSEYANLEFDLRSSTGTLPPPATGTGYTIDSASALLAGKMVYALGGAITLVYGKGYSLAANNGVKPLTADVAATDTTVTVAGTAAETPSTNASLQVCGVRTDDVTVTVAADGTGTLVSAGDISDWSTLGLRAGMYVHVGGVDTDDTVTNSPTITATTVYGYVRVVSINGATLNFDKADTNLLLGGAGASSGSETVDFLFGRFVRDVPTAANSDDNRYGEFSYHFEASYPNLGSGGATEYEYSVGNFANELSFNVPLTDKSTLTLGFIGTNSEVITASRKTGAASAVSPLRNTAFSSSIDLVSISTDLISSVSDVCFKSLTITFLNNVSPEKCLGTLGARFMNAGLFELNIEGQLLFTTKEIVNAIRNNQTVTFASIVRNADGAVAVDVPELTMGGGGREFPVDQSVLVNVTGNSFTSNQFNHNAGVTIFPVVPQAA